MRSKLPLGLFNAVRNRIEFGEVARERPAWCWSTPGRPARRAWAWRWPPSPPRLFPRQRRHANIPTVPLQVADGPAVTSTALASSIRQHALSHGWTGGPRRLGSDGQLATQDGNAGTQDVTE